MNFVVAVMILVAAEAEKETSSATKKRNQSMKFSYEETTLDHIYKCQDKQHRVECTVFNLMCAFLDNFDMQELWRPCVPQLKLRIYQFGRLLHRKLPVLEAHFAEIGVTPDFFASQWFLTLMSYNLPLDLLVRVWDVLVIDGWKTIFRVGISLLKIIKSELMEMGLEELSRFFRHNKLSVAQQDLLRESFFNCKISTRLLSELESDYVGYVLRSQLYKEEGSKLNRSQALLLEPTKVIDKRLAASIQAEIESMELPLKNDIPILRGKIEQAEKARVEAYEEFKAAAEEYEAVRLDLEELRKANLAEKSDWIESQIETVNEKYQEVIWRTSQAQVILEEALERKNAFSQQLFVVMHENEQNKVAHITKFKSLLL
uniref:Rab-GAP TBC domain-containing protein n=1 Tax=Aplanochytrium stocchinoi TaxID=215587 RepID=A0A6S8B316_9STRA